MTGDSAAPGSLDRIFDALSHPYRRRILLLVSEHNPRDEDEFSVVELATEDDDLELLTTELYHAHLPKLAESGYIEWDEDIHSIRRGPNFDEIAPLLRLMDDYQDELPEGWP
ncbi:winged helix-turn-helix domain-containing protein [Halomicrococcus sp. NG-SE-24]|uniref:winged helix-turn-helix domain-containing protein n=1 Tax=Halomicrococcus sp. NG-SE-24 TaxID=3436928 RepID=UPI003D979E05